MNTTTVAQDRSATENALASRLFFWVLFAFGTVQTLTGMFALAGSPPADGETSTRVFFLLVMFVHASVAVYLLINARDQRTTDLAAALLLVSCAFALKPLKGIGEHSIISLPAEAFMPYFLWRFFLAFPDLGATSRLERWWLRLVLVFTAILFLSNFLLAAGVAAEVLELFNDSNPLGYYDAVVYGLALLALITFVFRISRANVAERERAGFFLRVLMVSITLPCAYIVWYTVAQNTSVTIPGYIENNEFSLQILLLLNPIAVAYAVVVDEMLPARFVVRQSLRYMIGTSVIAVVSLVPAVLFAVNIYWQRHNTIVQLFESSAIPILGFLMLFGFLTYRERGRISASLQKRFFKDTYELDEALTDVVALADRVGSLKSLDTEVEAIVARYLRAGGYGMISIEAGRFDAISDQAVTALSVLEYPTFRNDTHIAPGLLAWMQNGSIEAVLPVHRSSGELSMVITLKRKKSLDRYSETDRKLLLGLKRSVEITIASLDKHDASQVSSDLLQLCPDCGRCHPSETRSCHGATIIGNIPYLFHGRFRVEQVIGRGNSSTVYRAFDQQLRRHVAVKTVQASSAREARMFRRESIVAAGFACPNLAMIYDAVLWNDLPVLVFELMDGGILEAIVEQGSMPHSEVLRLGIELTSGLRYLHDRDTLHRDIKPGNVGFSADGTPKLLDFGLARATTAGGGVPIDIAQTETMNTTCSAGGLVGTPLYWSPSILKGNPVSETDDVWALGVCLLECLLGRHPFERQNWQLSATAILSGDLSLATPLDDSPILSYLTNHVLDVRPFSETPDIQRFRADLHAMI